MSRFVKTLQVILPNNTKLYSVFEAALPAAFKSARWLLSLMIPISLVVELLKFTGILAIISGYLNPVFQLLGLSGQCAFVFLTSITLNIYSAIAVISTLPLTMREITIMAFMCLVSHNLIMETIVQRKTGSSAITMVLIRLLTSLVGAIIFNLVLPASPITNSLMLTTAATSIPFWIVMKNWFIAALLLSIKVIVFVTTLMLIQKSLEAFGIFPILSKIFSPFLKILGLPEKASFLWIVANVVGLAYGSAIMFDELKNNRISKHETNLLNYHIAVSHSMLEDTLLFVAIGVSIWWITFPRIVFAMIIVWGRKLLAHKQFMNSYNSTAITL